MPLKKFKIILTIYEKKFFNIFIVCCNLYKTDKYLPFNFVFKLPEGLKNRADH